MFKAFKIDLGHFVTYQVLVSNSSLSKVKNLLPIKIKDVDKWTNGCGSNYSERTTTK